MGYHHQNMQGSKYNEIFPGYLCLSFSDENGERITVISITPHHVSSTNNPGSHSLKKSNLKQSSKYGDGTYDYASYSRSSNRPREQSDESNMEEYQIEGLCLKSVTCI